MARTKSRANGDGDVWPRKNKEGRIYGYRGTYVGPDGRRRYVSSKNKEDARRKLRAARADSDRGLLFDTEDLRLGDYLDSWLTDSVKDTVRRTEDLRTLRVHSQGAHQARPRPRQARCPDPQPRPPPLPPEARQRTRPRTVNYIHVTLHKALKDAISDALIPRNAASVRARDPKNPKYTPLSRPGAQAHSHGPRNRRPLRSPLRPGPPLRPQRGRTPRPKMGRHRPQRAHRHAPRKAHPKPDQDRPHLRKTQERQRPLHKVLPEGHEPWGATVRARTRKGARRAPLAG